MATPTDLKDDPQFGHSLAEFQAVSGKIREACGAMQVLKGKDAALQDEKNTMQLAALQSRCQLLFLELKQLNRDLTTLGQGTKRKVQVQKSAQDQLNLEMQGLQYEKMHFIKEIKKARDFKPAFDQMELISLEEFHASTPEATELSPHDLHLRRLAQELQARQSLLGEVKELNTKRQKVQKENEQKRAFLDGLDSKLTTLYADACTIQAGLPGGAPVLPPPATCAVLPRPLYNLYNLAASYKTHFNEALHLSIVGDASSLSLSSLAPSSSISSSSSSSTSSSSSSSTDIASPSPLSVALSLKVGGKNVTLTCKYLRTYGVVTVASSGKGVHATLLCNLFPGDDGQSIPSIRDHLLPTAAAAATQINHKELGTPYLWAQTLSGLHFNNPRQQSYAHVQLMSVVRRLEHRGLVRANLSRQLTCLGKKQLPALQPGMEKLLPVKSKVAISKWSKLKAADFCMHTQEEPTAWWRTGAEHFQLAVTRGSTTLDVLVEVCAEYPTRPPQFHLFFNLKGDASGSSKALVPNALVRGTADKAALALSVSKTSQLNGEKYNYLKDMEREVNTRFPQPLVELALQEERGAFDLLCFQVRKLQACFDVVVESSRDATQYNAGNLFEQAIRGRDRRKPFVFDHHTHSFSQA